MEFRTLGPLEAVGADGPVTLPRGRGRGLLALLIMHAGQVAPTERLIDQLWGGAPPLWRGPALAEFTYEPVAQAKIAALLATFSAVGAPG